MCKWAERRPPELKDGFWSLQGPPARSEGPKDKRWMASGNLKNRATEGHLWRTGWSETSSFSPLLSFFFMSLTQSPVRFRCSYSEQVGWVTQLLCSGFSLATSPFFLPLLLLFFFLRPLLSTLPLYSPFSLFAIYRSICALGVLGWTDKIWLGFVGVVCRKRRNIREEWGSERAASRFPCCSCWLSLCLRLISWSFTFATVTMTALVPSRFISGLSVDTSSEAQHNCCAQLIFPKISLLSSKQSHLEVLTDVFTGKKTIAWRMPYKTRLLWVENVLFQIFQHQKAERSLSNGS